MVVAVAKEKDWRFGVFFFPCCGLVVVVAVVVAVAEEKDWRFEFFFFFFLAVDCWC